MQELPSFRMVLVGNINRCVSWYLVHSYLYYILGSSIIDDNEYDALCKRIYCDFDTITHPHKSFIDKDSLAAGSGFSIRQYPNIVINCALLLQRRYLDGYYCDR